MVENLDIEMLGEGDKMNKTLNFHSQLQDLSMMTIRRGEDLANIKIQYEEQIETLRNQLKYEMSKN